MKRTYDVVDKSRVEFLGVAFDKATDLRKILEEKEIKWPQILRENEDGIIRDYKISGYPTSFLIDPTGKIIAKNLQEKKLLDTLQYYLQKKEK